MKIIQVHVHDSDLTSTVSQLLNQGLTISVDLDVLDDGEAAVATTTRLVDDIADEMLAINNKVPHYNDPDNKLTRKQVIKAQRQAADAFIAQREMRHAEREAHQARYDTRWARAQEARIVECPSCSALVDHPCQTPQGKAYGAFVHSDRIRAMQTAKTS